LAFGAVDAGLCDLAKRVLGVGTVSVYPRRKAHYDDEAVYVVQRTQHLVERIVPFMDVFLPRDSHKSRQYEVWRAALLDHWEHHARRRRSCTVEGCEELQRGRGLCRRHYYQEFGV
jgi:hypothetical protein